MQKRPTSNLVTRHRTVPCGIREGKKKNYQVSAKRLANGHLDIFIVSKRGGRLMLFRRTAATRSGSRSVGCRPRCARLP